jgi:hypothetical protein
MAMPTPLALLVSIAATEGRAQDGSTPFSTCGTRPVNLATPTNGQTTPTPSTNTILPSPSALSQGQQ